MKKILFVFFILVSFLYSQEIKHKLPIYFDYIVVPTEKANKCIISYKIPFNQLVFVKEGNVYKSGVSISFDIKNGSEIARVFDERIVYSENYDNTQSRIIFLEGIVETELADGKYKITPTIELQNTNISSPLVEYELNIKKDDDVFIKPFVTIQDNYSCINKEGFLLSNFRGNLSFANSENILLFPIRKYNPDSIKVTIIQKNKLLVSKFIKSKFSGEIDLEICDSKILLPKVKSNAFTFYLLEDFSDKIDEGEIEIKIELPDVSKSMKLESEWINKPRSLRSMDLAVRSLRVIDEDENFHKLYDDESYEDLKKFWKKYDPTPDTEFNELMNEFYLRVDYSIREFSNLKSFDGAFTDRGEVYIKYGKPDKIDRNYNRRNEIIETWVYNKLDKMFMFKDISGSGNFKLIN